jgi:hypothetical protein
LVYNSENILADCNADKNKLLRIISRLHSTTISFFNDFHQNKQAFDQIAKGCLWGNLIEVTGQI